MRYATVGILIATILGLTSAVHAASLQKARALVDNGFHDEAKRELIDVLYASDTKPNEKSAALYLLGTINAEQGNGELANKNWQELIDRHPRSSEAQLARQRLGANAPNTRLSSPADSPEPASVARMSTSSLPSRASQSASGGVHLLSAGQSPQFLLRYAPSTVPEQARTVVRMAMFDGDCPTKPSAEKYPSVDIDVATKIETKQDGRDGVLKAHLTHRMSGKLEGESSEPEVLEEIVRFTETGKVLEASSGDMDPFGAGFTLFPVEAVGQGAIWESPFSVEMIRGGMFAKATYTVEAIDSYSAKILVKFSMDAKFGEDGQVGRVEAGGDGTLIWRAGRIMSPGSSGAMFFRMSEQSAAQDEGSGKIGCALMTYGTT